MFLTKKNAHLVNKGKTVPNKRPLGGWQDDEQTPSHKQTQSKIVHAPPQQINLLEDNNETSITKKTSNEQEPVFITPQDSAAVYYDWEALNERTDIDCQKYLIENIVQPGGIRIKPNDSMLSDMLKQVKGMEVSHIGSLLLSKLEVNYPFQVKAKALYTIEYLAKKDKQYENYFKEHADKIKQFPEPEDNIDSYKKIQKSVLNQIGTKITAQISVQESKPVFVDPGYYQEPPKSQMSSFLDKNVNKPKKTAAKKPIIGPGQAKNIMIEKKKSGSQHSQQANLLDSSEPTQKPSGSTGLESLLQLKQSSEPNNDLLV